MNSNQINLAEGIDTNTMHRLIGGMKYNGEIKEKKKIIINTAIELFNEFGYNSVGVDKIIDKAGIAKTTLYRYFPSKEKLVVAVLEEIGNRYIEDMDSTATSLSSDPTEKLLATFDFLKEWFQHESFFGCPFIKAAGDYCNKDHIVFKQSQKYKMEITEYFEQLVNDANLDNPKSLAENISTLHEGATSLAFISGKSIPADIAKDMAKTLITIK